MIPIIDTILGITSKFIPDTDAQNKLKVELKSKMEDTFKEAVKADKEIQLAEMRSGGLRSKWRPLAALSVFLTLFLHWFILPLAHFIIVAFNINVYVPMLDPLPIEYYGLAMAFISIYAYGRSREKEASNIK